MKYVSRVRAVRVAHNLKFFFVALAALFAATASSNATTVDWTGGNNFNDGTITFKKFMADQLTDIFGTGLYEACCKTGSTDFTLQLDLNGNWTTILTWSATGDNTTHALGDLVPPVIDFTLAYVSGIRLKSDPNGQPKSDYNFTDFNFVTYLSQQEYYDLNKSKYNSWDDYVKCGDYERYVKNVTSFSFCIDCITAPSGDGSGGISSTPLPGALPLFIGGGGLLGLLGWRRKRRKAQLAA